MKTDKYTQLIDSIEGSIIDWEEGLISDQEFVAAVTSYAEKFIVGRVIEGK